MGDDMSYAEMLKLNAKDPQKPAIIYREKVVSYGELNRRVNRLANALSSLGYRSGDKVAILMKNCNEFLESYFALTKIGVIPVSFNYRLTDHEFKHIINNSDAKGIIVEENDSYAERIRALDLALEHYIVVGSKSTSPLGERSFSYDDLLKRASDKEPEHPAYTSTLMLHTSGTTGLPKGTLRSKWGFFYRVVEQGFMAEDKALSAVPVCLSFGAGYTLMSLYIGQAIYLMREFDPEQALKTIEKQRITCTYVVPTMLQEMIAVSDLSKYDLSSMRAILAGGGAVPDATKVAVTEAFGEVLNIYAASTEAGPYANLRPKDILRKLGSNCVGRPFYGVELVLLDEDGKEVPVGGVGEICTRSPFQFDEYYKDPVATQETRRGSYVTVGDLGRFDDEGFLYFEGRKRDMIKSGGINVYAPEIEEVIMTHPKVKDAAVIGVSDPTWIEAIRAIVVLKEGAEATPEEIMEYCQERLAPYKKPRSVIFTDKLPRNLTGKVVKRELQERFGNMEKG